MEQLVKILETDAVKFCSLQSDSAWISTLIPNAIIFWWSIWIYIKVAANSLFFKIYIFFYVLCLFYRWAIMALQRFLSLVTLSSFQFNITLMVMFVSGVVSRIFWLKCLNSSTYKYNQIQIMFESVNKWCNIHRYLFVFWHEDIVIYSIFNMTTSEEYLQHLCIDQIKILTKIIHDDFR